VSPQLRDGKPANQTFDTDELLFRRVAKTHIEDGEVSLLAISRGFKLTKSPPDCGSVLRSKYCSHFSDALHRDCNGGKECSDFKVHFLSVGALANGFVVQPPEKPPIRAWDLFPYHDPLEKCYPHSTVCSCEQSQPGIAVEPPPSVRVQFRTWIRDNLKSCEQASL